MNDDLDAMRRSIHRRINQHRTAGKITRTQARQAHEANEKVFARELSMFYLARLSREGVPV